MTSPIVLLEYLNSWRASFRYISTPRLNATPGQCPSRVTIKSVSDEVLLNIFRYFLDVSPRDWPRLVHTCRKWRRIALASQGALRLRLFCTHGTPVQKTLHFWPALPIVVEYGGLPTLVPPVLEDEDNIIAALKQSDRVISISLTVTSSLMEKLSAVEKPFSELQDLVLLSRDGEPLTLPSTFWCGQRLRRLHSTGIAFPALLQPFYSTSSTNLIDLQLHDAFLPWKFSPVILKNVLSKMTQLRSLSLHFSSITLPIANSHFPLLRHQEPSQERVILSVLTRVNYRGSIEYLRRIVAMIDAPSLEDIEITSDNPVLPLPEFKTFINRIEMYRSFRVEHILSSEPAISISLTQPGAPTRLSLQVFYKPLCRQILPMTQINFNFSPFLFKDEEGLRNSWRDSLNVRELLKLLNNFTERRYGNVLPAPHKLYIPQPGPRHAFLRETVVSFMISRRLSGHPIEVEYEQQCGINEQREAGTSSQQETAEMLSEDILHHIFRRYLDAFPQSWLTLVWVCQKWRQIIFTSTLGLNIRLHCTYKTPVLKALCVWPALPITIQYGGAPNLDPPASEDDNNIIAALKQFGRVSSISLTVTSSLRKKLSAISEPFTQLEDFVLFSQDNLQLTFPSSFHLGPRLRTVHLSRIAIPSLPRLLSPSQFLVDIQLHEIPITGYFPPEAFANALSGTTQIRSLSLHFLSLPPRRNYLRLPPPPGERAVLPALTCLKYRGTSKYLDSFVARIDAPRLSKINITFFYQPTMDASQLGHFIGRTEIHTSVIQADIKISADAISISSTRSRASTPLRLQISCKQIDWQLSCMAQVCDQISPFLSRVSDLGIYTAPPLGGRDDWISEQWLALLRSFKFSGALYFCVDGEVTTTILRALGPANERNAAMLPSLRHFDVGKHMEMVGPSWDSVQSFITSRWVSGHPVEFNAPFYRCQICRDKSAEQQGLRRHLGESHGYQVLCSYCGEFECTPGQPDLFREHLEDRHPEIAHNNVLISTPSLAMDSLVYRHTSLRAPDVVPPLPTSESMELHSSLPMFSDSDLDFSECDSDV